jgi:hypothetical protein
LADRQHFGMRRWVAVAQRTVAGTSHYRTVADDHATDRDLAGAFGGACFNERLLHEGRHGSRARSLLLSGLAFRESRNSSGFFDFGPFSTADGISFRPKTLQLLTYGIETHGPQARR